MPPTTPDWAAWEWDITRPDPCPVPTRDPIRVMCWIIMFAVCAGFWVCVLCVVLVGIFG